MCKNQNIGLIITRTVLSDHKIIDVKCGLIALGNPVENLVDPETAIREIVDIISPIPEEGFIGITALPYCMSCGGSVGGPYGFAVPLEISKEEEISCKRLAFELLDGVVQLIEAMKYIQGIRENLEFAMLPTGPIM